jgi:hypothetical protein
MRTIAAISIARSQFKFHRLGRDTLMDQSALDDGAQMHVDSVVFDISGDPRLGLKFQKLGRMDRPDHGSVDYEV